MARTDPRSSFKRARSAQSPGQRKVGEGTPSSTGDVAMRKPVRITVDLPEDVHQRLRIHVSRERTNTQAFVRSLIEQALPGD